MRMRSPLAEWRERYGLSVADLADLCNVSEAQIARIEAGKQGLIGEVQECLTKRGENVSEMASAQSAFLAMKRGLPLASDEEAGEGGHGGRQADGGITTSSH
jgi:DNA-binding XRE family transcriptional regulator